MLKSSVRMFKLVYKEIYSEIIKRCTENKKFIGFNFDG